MVAPTCGIYGGIEAFTASIAEQVLAADPTCEVRVVYRLRGGYELSPNLAEGMASHGVAYRLMRKPDWQYLKDLLWADVVNCHFPLIYATIPARLFGKKLVLTIENQLTEHHSWMHRLGLQLGHLRWYISDFVSKTWEGEQRHERTTIVPAITHMPDEWAEPAARKGFLFTARWVPLKGLEQLVEAYAQANLDRDKHPLILIGKGPLESEIHARISELKIEKHVTCLGFVSQEKKIHAMSHVRWNVAPSVFAEDLGLTPIEARGCGVPSIVSRTGGLPEAAGDCALFCEAGDIPSLVAALENAANMNESEYLRRAEEAKKTLANYLPSDTFYVEEFRRLLEG